MEEKRLSKQTQRHAYNLLRKMFRDAAEDHLLLNYSPVLRKARPKVPIKESRYLSISQARELLQDVTGMYGIAIWLQFFLGLRAGEVQALRWEDVDLTTGVLHVRRTYARLEKVFRDHPKGRKQFAHKIPLELLVRLKDLRESSQGELVVVPEGYQMLEYSKYRKVLVHHCKALGIPAIATHGLRHSTSELYMQHGATSEDVMALLGQKEVKTTQRYIHNRGSRLEGLAEIVRLFPEGSQNVPKSLSNEGVDPRQESC